MKKGFTLIELLAVIVVLAVISVIAVPTLIGVINKARLNSLKSSAYGLIEASNLYYAQYQNENNIRFDIEGSKVVSTDTTKMLKFKGNVKEGVSIIKGNGKTVVCVTDGKNSAYKNYNESQVSLVSGKCTIPNNSSIVYLDGEATIDSVDAKAILDRLDEIENKINNIGTSGTSSGIPVLDYGHPVHVFGTSIPSGEPTTQTFGLTFTATEDCYIHGRLAGGVTTNIELKINGILAWRTSNVYSGQVGYAALDGNMVNSLHISAGDVVVVSAASPQLHIFKAKES